MSPKRFICVGRRRVADDGGGAAGSFRNQFQMRLQRGILRVPQQQAVGVTLHDGQDII